ncbi:MAG: T9SS type A sorting domain-containing protein [Gemmatimonadetes bacterium]|nr:T9SS type A sorting domain-containing protein [Gemmatimonadota bacterium]
MKSLIGSFIGLVLSISVGAEPLLEGRVSLSSGQPAVGVQVRLFDWTDLRRSVGTTTDETGHFALPLRAFSTARGMALPTDFALGQNYPNPFNPSTIIPYQLPTSAHVRLEVFNLLGQRLATLVDAERSAGVHTAQWDATDATGRAVGAGVYIYRLSSGEMTESRRMVLVDGQAGIPVAAAPRSVRSAGEGAVEADGSVYGLTVSGEGLVAYVNPTFRVGVDEVVDIVVEEHSSARMKLAADGVLGDVDGNGQVDVFDVLFVLLYSVDPSIVLPNSGDISRGDVNGDGLVDVADSVLLLRYLSNPFDPELPPGIGQDSDGTLDGATPVDLGSSTDGSLSEEDTDYFRVTMTGSGILTVSTTGSVDTEGAILDSSGTVLARDSDSGEGWNFRVSVPVSAGTYYIAVEGWGSDTGDYTLDVQSLTCTIDSELVGTWTEENVDISGLLKAYVDYFISIGLSQTTAEDQVKEIEEELLESYGDIRFYADCSVFSSWENPPPTGWNTEDDILFLIADGVPVPFKYFLDGDELHLTQTKALFLSFVLERGDLDAASREIAEAVFGPLDKDYVLMRIVLKRKS